MSRNILKSFCAAIAVIAGLIGISSACVTTNTNRQYSYNDTNCSIPDAISTIRTVMDAGNYYTELTNDINNSRTNLSWPTTSQRASYDTLFTGLIHTLWYDQNKNTASKLATALNALLSDMQQGYTNQSLSNDERVKFGYLYFLTRASVNALRNLNGTSNGNGTPTGTIDGLTQVQTYTALNDMQYTLWHSSIYYLFSKGDSTNVNISMRARSLDDLINYIEYQNRVIVQAPNNRYYAIRKYNNAFNINRDNGSVLDKTFGSFNDAIQFLNTCAVNTKVDASQHSYCGFDTYGRK